MIVVALLSKSASTETTFAERMDTGLLQSLDYEQLSDNGQRKGLSIFTTALFAVGAMAGAGILSLPNALVGTGGIGILLNLICAAVATFTAILLGRSWIMVRERHVEYRGHVRNPYPTIAQVCLGNVGRLIVTCSLNISLFGGCTVYLLLASGNIENLVHQVGKEISFCYWLIIMAAILCPLVWFGSPKDSWLIAVGAVAATVTACVLILTNIIKDKLATPELLHIPAVNFLGFFKAFGVICFSYGGHATFPTFQVDMRRPRDFGKAISLAYFIVLVLYVPLATVGYYTYGRGTEANILDSMSKGPVQTVVTILITIHILFGFVILSNPVMQQCEEMLRIPKHFTVWRALFRTSFITLVLFVGESIPKFGAILSLIGGSTITIIIYILPPIMYLRLSYMKGDWEHKPVPLHIKVACVEVIALGVLCGIFSTYSAIVNLADNVFSSNCYSK